MRKYKVQMLRIFLVLMLLPLSALALAAPTTSTPTTDTAGGGTTAPKTSSPQTSVPATPQGNNNTNKFGAGQPFGGNLFSSQTLTGSKEPLNPNYQIVPGDQIDVQTWGAMDFNASVPVDNQGNIFLPQVGPVDVMGVTQQNLNDTVKSKVGQVYKNNVKTYASLRGSLPISVFVSGAVTQPGRYVGTSTDSVLDYVYKAGGIDAERGSYRSISVVRNNIPIEDFDIYDFLLNGNLKKFQIREGDIILVKQRGKVVNVSGEVKNPYMFEFRSEKIKGSDVILYAAPLSTATNVVITGTRDTKPYKSYVTLNKLAETELKDGDVLEFSGGTHEDKISVNITGRHKGPKVMVLPLDAKLGEVLRNIPVDESVSNVNAVYIKRRSVADKQKLAIKDSVQRLQESLLLARASGTTQTSPVDAGDVSLLTSFIARVEAVEPEGRVVFADQRDYNSVLLEDGDEIVIPQKSNLVLVNGEVILPKAIVWEKGLSVSDYIEKAGGFTANANESEVVVVRNNGETVLGTSVKMKPGDEIMVLPEIKLNSIEVTSQVVDILYKVAVAAVIPFTL